jgi:ribose 1,5-bisphosphokinase
MLIPVVGPSGAGKDTLIDAARAARPDIHVPQRVITRDASAGGEDFRGVSDAQFQALSASGAFALEWRAHGLCYGIPATILTALDEGQIVVFNGSRGIIDSVRARFASVLIVVVTAAPAILAERLALRGRESAEQVKARLERMVYASPTGDDVVQIDNSGDLDRSVARFLAALPHHPIKG